MVCELEQNGSQQLNIIIISWMQERERCQIRRRDKDISKLVHRAMAKVWTTKNCGGHPTFIGRLSAGQLE